jgi:hypothetical protein
MKKYALVLPIVYLLVTVTACKKPVNPNDLPVSYWATAEPHKVSGSTDCSVASAKAILKSGLPYPNYGTVDEISKGDVTIRKRIKTMDVWLGGTRFVFPVEIVRTGGYPERNPNNVRGLGGTLPHFYPKGEKAVDKDGMGAMVDVSFSCSMQPERTESWGKRYRSNAEAIDAAKKEYERSLARNPSMPGTVTVRVRDDLDMTEILMEVGSRPHGFWEATYVPLHTELRGLDGGVSRIVCRTRHQPSPNLTYGAGGKRCGSGIRITPQTTAVIEIYVSHLEEMPNVFEQVKQVIINAKKAGE